MYICIFSYHLLFAVCTVFLFFLLSLISSFVLSLLDPRAHLVLCAPSVWRKIDQYVYVHSHYEYIYGKVYVYLYICIYIYMPIYA